MSSGERDFLVDLECGGGAPTTSTTTATTITLEEERNEYFVSSCRIGRKTLNNGVMSGVSDSDSGDNVLNMSNAACGRRELLVDKCSGCEETREVKALLEKRSPGEHRKKQNLKKSSKPPRPPTGPLLNASDLKLVKELTEIAARKRARIERMKALRKAKETKRATSSSSLTALVITVLFFVVIVFQGIFCGSSGGKELLESPAPASTNAGLISIQLFNNAPMNEMMNQPSFVSFNSMEQASSSSPEEEGRDAG